MFLLELQTHLYNSHKEDSRIHLRHCQNPNSQYCQRHQVHLLLRSRHVFWGKPIVISPSVSSICQRSPYALNHVHLSTTTVTIIPPNRRRFMYARLFTGGLFLVLLLIISWTRSNSSTVTMGVCVPCTWTRSKAP